MRVSRTALAHAAPLLLAACAPAVARRTGTRPLPPVSVGADSATARRIADGVTLHRLWFARGPQAVQLLDVDRAACWTLAARKAGGASAGRAGTLALVRGLADSGAVAVAGGVNADFFLFAPPGVPTGAHVQDGRVITGPGARPVLALDSAGAVHVGRLQATGRVALAGGELPIDGWNRAGQRGLALFDEGYGARTDSAPARLFVTLRRIPGRADGLAVVAGVDSGAILTISPGTAVLATGESIAPDARERLGTLRVGDTLRLSVALAPVAPRQAVGGFPVLVRDGRIDPQVDSAGNAGFRGPNPRTAIGIAADGRRLLLVTNDGRQAGYSAGMSLRELAALFVALGARDALNLDGGGSTTLVVADGANGFRIANRPSDRSGDRGVGDGVFVPR
jgi:hypothetical protein